MSIRIDSQINSIKNNFRLWRLNRQVAAHAKVDFGKETVVVFNVSSRLRGISQNAAFTLLTSWGLRLASIPVKYFVCHSGMSHCVLGINRENFGSPPPCKVCIRQSRRLYRHADVFWFKYQVNQELYNNLQDLNVEELSEFEYRIENSNSPLSAIKRPLPLGKLVLPSIRWTLRRHQLPDDEDNRYLLRQYILSAFNIAQEFAAFIDQINPTTALIFNGILYPEGVARWVALEKGIRVVTHEVSFQPFSAFFTTAEATTYPIEIPKEFTLSEAQNRRIDEYLEKRFQGKFSMAGIQFWPEMRGLDDKLLQKISEHKQLVTIFTNVVYDTSQVHANQVFPHMFAWLDLLLKIIGENPDTLFIIRAHPDEMRPGTAKQSKESVRDWIYKNQVNQLPNTFFIDSQEYISSYDLIQRSKFIMVYNSSIGMEATLMGKAVLCGGKARFTQYPIVFFPDTTDEYLKMAEDMLTSETSESSAVRIEAPLEFVENARRFLYYQLFRASLSFEDYIEASSRKGFIQLKPFSWQNLLEENSQTMRILVNGIARDSKINSFLLEEN